MMSCQRVSQFGFSHEYGRWYKGMMLCLRPSKYSISLLRSFAQCTTGLLSYTPTQFTQESGGKNHEPYVWRKGGAIRCRTLQRAGRVEGSTREQLAVGAPFARKQSL